MALAKVAACVVRRREHRAQESSTGGGGLTCYSACDIDVVCQRVLKDHPPDSAAEHCFGDLCARPPSNVVRQLRARQRHYRRQAGTSTSGASAKKAQRIQRAGRAWVAEAMTILDKGWDPERGSGVECCRHHRLCPACPRRSGRYHLEVSGVNCQPWSSAGKRLGWLDDRSIPCLILVRSIMAVEPDGVCIECTPAFDFDALASVLEPKYRGNFTITSPQDLGIPVARKRMYMWFDRVKTLAETHRCVSEFVQISRRAPGPGPEQYLSASADEVLQYYRKLLAQQGRERKGGSEARSKLVPPRRAPCPRPGDKLTLRDVLQAGNLHRYHGHLQRIAEQTSPEACHIIDVNVSPGWAGTPSSTRVPTLLKSSCLVAVFGRGSDADRLLLPSELPAIHGLELPSSVVSRLPARAVRSLIGNSMHVAQVGSFLLYALATRSFRSL